MPLITMNVPQEVSTSILGLLQRIAVALERIAGPELQYTPPTPSTMADYAIVSPEESIRIKTAQEEFAAGHLVVPGSPAYLAAVAEFETQVAEAYGEDAVEKLPWRVQKTSIGSSSS